MTVQARETFGSLLRRHRLSSGLSQEALAERAGLSSAAIAHLERGRRNAPRLLTVGLLADALHLDQEHRAALIAAATNGAGAPSAPEATPASSPPPPGNPLPAPPTGLIGRERDVARITHFIRRAGDRAGTRLLTLSGAGGMGKTRLALAAAAEVRDAFADGVVFVDLSVLREPTLVAAAVALAVGVEEAGSGRVAERLRAYLAAKQLLLVLDNFEHLVEAAPLVADLLAHGPRLVIVVTSRTALRVRGERLYEVGPLPVAEPGGNLPLEVLANYAGVRLFVDRAQAVKPEFQLDTLNGEAVTRICARLDGLPLAIELAASLVRLLPPAALLARLEQRLPLLVGGPRDLPARQQTLRAAIDWSYDLLEADEQHLFASLGVFAGGCTLDALEAIHGASWSLDLPAALVDKSLVRQTERNGEVRIGMLETLHEYARERLRDQGTLEELSRRHAEYYLAFAEAVQPDFSGPGQRAWLERLDGEHDNLRAVLRWAGESGATEIGLRIAGVLWRLWYVHGRFTEGRLWLDQLLRDPGEVPLPVLADAVRGAAALAMQQMDLGPAAMWCDKSLDLFRRLGNTRGVADVLNARGNVARDQGDYARATALHEDSLALYRDLDDRQGIAVALNNLGATARYLGNFDRAAALCGESLALRRQMGDSRGMAWALHNLGGVARMQRDAARARAYFAEGLALSHEVGDRLQSARCLEGLAALASIQGQADLAARLFGAASSLRVALGSGLAAADQALYDEDMRRVRADLGADAFVSAWAAGMALGLDQAIAAAAGVGECLPGSSL